MVIYGTYSIQKIIFIQKSKGDSPKISRNYQKGQKEELL